VAREAMKSADGAPQRIRDALADALAEAVFLREEGDVKESDKLIRETIISIGAEKFDAPDNVPNPRELAARIPRG
jgi:hypothetical protein